MKKTKLLTSLAALVLVVGLGACSEPEEEEPSDETGGVVDTETDEDTQSSSDTSSEEGDDGSKGGEGGDTIISEDVEDALTLLGEKGADVSSWSGVNYHYYLDESETMYGIDYYGEVYETNILATETDGVVTGLYEDLSSMSMFGYTLYTEEYYEFYNGSTLFSLEDSELSSEEKEIALSYFTYYPYYYAEEDIEYYAEFKGLTALYEFLGYHFEGSVTQTEEGNLVVYVAYSSEYEDYDYEYGYGTIVGSFIASLEVVYDANDGLVSLDYEIYEDDSYTDLNMGLIYIQSETISDFAGTIDTPDWVSQG